MILSNVYPDGFEFWVHNHREDGNLFRIHISLWQEVIIEIFYTSIFLKYGYVQALKMVDNCCFVVDLVFILVHMNPNHKSYKTT